MFYLDQILISINFEPHLLEINPPPSKFPPTRIQNHTCPSQYFLPQSTSSPSGFFLWISFFKSNTYAGGPFITRPQVGLFVDLLKGEQYLCRRTLEEAPKGWLLVSGTGLNQSSCASSVSTVKKCALYKSVVLL